MPSELEQLITSFLRGAELPDDVSEAEAARYWHLAGAELDRVISGLGGNPMFATAHGEPAVLCLGERGAALITLSGDDYVVHQTRRKSGTVSIRETSPLVSEHRDHKYWIEISIQGSQARSSSRACRTPTFKSAATRSCRPSRAERLTTGARRVCP